MIFYLNILLWFKYLFKKLFFKKEEKYYPFQYLNAQSFKICKPVTCNIYVNMLKRNAIFKQFFKMRIGNLLAKFANNKPIFYLNTFKFTILKENSSKNNNIKS